jgi:DNA-binding LacI/PurR family transcriptional regulator
MDWPTVGERVRQRPVLSPTFCQILGHSPTTLQEAHRAGALRQSPKLHCSLADAQLQSPTCQTNRMAISGNSGRTAPTLEQVAAAAGVSRATASRVLRGSPHVSAAAREAVRSAATALDYAPNLAARSLVTGRSDTVAFVVEETEHRLLSDPFFLGLLRGAHAVIANAQQHLVLSVIASALDAERLLQYAGSGHVDGVLMLSLHAGGELAVALEARGVPTVLAARPLSECESLFYVDSDNRAGARMATRYLIERGCRRIATISGAPDMAAGQDRVIGWRQALTDAGLAASDSMIEGGNFTADGGYRAMTALLAREPALDAVFAASDLMALGACRAANVAGRPVGQNLAIVGFDDIDEAVRSSPSLTTIRQPLAAMGRAMSEVLLQRISGDAAPQSTVVPVELVVRESA